MPPPGFQPSASKRFSHYSNTLVASMPCQSLILSSIFSLKLPSGFFQNTEHAVGMNVILSTHNVTLTKAIDDHLASRIKKLEHLNSFATSIRVVLEHDQTKALERQFACSMRVSMPGPDLFAEDVEGDLYAAIDLVSKKVEQQLRKRQTKHKARQ